MPPPGKKRAREGKEEENDDYDGPITGGEGASIGQQTSHIKNKLRRSELYSKLKHQQKVISAGLAGLLLCRTTRANYQNK